MDKQNKDTEKNKQPVTVEIKQADEPAKDRSGANNWPKWGRRFLLFALVVFFFAILSVVREILLPFILSVVVAYILAPVVDWMSSKKVKNFFIPRWVAVIVIYIVLGTAIFSCSVVVLPRFAHEFAKLAEDAPGFFKKASQKWIPELNSKVQGFIDEVTEPIEQEDIINGDNPDSTRELSETDNQDNGKNYDGDYDFEDMQVAVPVDNSSDINALSKLDAKEFLSALEGYNIDVESYSENKYRVRLNPSRNSLSKEAENGLDLNATFKQYMEELLNSGENLIKQSISLGQSVVSIIVGSLMTLVLTLMLAAFILVDTPAIMNFFRTLVPPLYRDEYDDILKGIDRGLGGVIRGQLMICLVNGTLTGIGLVILGVKYAFILALIATIFSLVPIFGTILSSIPSVGIALTQSFGLGLAVLIWIIIIHLIEANLLNPKIIGTSAKIHPVMVVFALVAGEYAYGLFGALLAVAAFSIFQTVFLYFKSKTYGEEV